MNWHHLQTFFWLHWRLRANQLKRGGTLNAVILALLAAMVVSLSFIVFVAGILVGFYLLADASPAVVMYVWDGLVVAMLFSWSIGLLSELQRSEALSMQNFLHLPVSVSGVFFLNYLSSLLSVTLALLVPAMVGITIGMFVGRGPAMIFVLPLLAAFLLAVTALTYQFQGWIASLMVNKRRRRTIIMLITGGFILLAQMPNIVNMYQPWKNVNRPAGHDVERIIHVANIVVPFGWLPLGAMEAATGNVLMPLGATAGLGLLGAASLRRAYRTTLRLYTGEFTGGIASAAAPVQEVVAATAAPSPPLAVAAARNFVEKDLPWLTEQAAAISLACFRSLTRAPEAKMMLLTPILIVGVFGGIVLREGVHAPPAGRFMLAVGAMTMILMTMFQLVGNQFGFDHDGFRVFVLSPVRRREILLGKNLAIAPLAIGLDIIAATLIEFVYPMPLDLFLALFPQLLAMYLVFCMVANFLSIYAPMAITPGTTRPTGAKLIPILLNLVAMMFFFSLIVPTLIPIGAEFLLTEFGWISTVPVCLILTMLQLVPIVFLYRLLITWQGDLLHAREQEILETVTQKAE